jgi:hemerythrin-like metal-binding protein/PAS domain S-box-containing protein
MYANAASGALLGMWGCAVGDTTPQFWCDLAAQALASKENKTVDIECDGKDYSMVVAPGAELGYVNLYGRDITERERAEQALRRSEEKYRDLVNEVNDGVFVSDSRGVLTFANQALARIHGFERPEELVGRTFIEFVAPAMVENITQLFRESIQSGTTSETIDAEIIRPNGIGALIEIKPVPIVENGKVLGIRGVVRDVTKRKQAEEGLISANKELLIQNEEKEKRAVELFIMGKETIHRLHHIQALHTIDQAISNRLNLRLTLSIVLEQVLSQMNVDAAMVLLFNPRSQTLEFGAGQGFHTETLRHTRLRLGDGYAGRAALEKQIVHIPDLQGHYTDFLHSPGFSREGFVCYYGVPLLVKDEVQGVLEIFHRSALNPNPEWLDFMETLAGQAAIAIDQVQLFDDLQRSNLELQQAYDATIEGWSQAMDLRDKETEGHTLRVTELTVRLARFMGMSENEIVHARRGALLHDMGKLGVPDAILLKPDKLNAAEWVLMKQHPQFAYDMLSPIAYLRPALDIPYCHHEKWDGTGYPRGLSGDQIPFAARIFAVVDVWDALTSDRPYRAAWPKEKVLDHIRSLAGTHFDPQVVKICLESGLLEGQSKRRMLMEPVQWSEKFSVGVKELDQQHQQLIKLLNRLISAQGTIGTHSETISEILMEMTRYAQVHFKTEERLMEAYGFPGLEEQKIQHRDFRKKTVDFCTATTIGVEQIPDALLEYLLDWWVHHILEDDMAYRSFFKDKSVG